jgi:hypothetical protein
VSRRPERLDFTDPAALRAWIVALRVAFDDAAGVTQDVLRPERKRSLGSVEHRRLFKEAKTTIASLLDYADPPGEPDPDDGEPSDPAGAGGSPCH